ncbi:tetratricopeptide repeat protein [candidate division KSB1 bacterium]|nr:tetratricopeptide repeat protein [candidate division KSB1 bacterium]
MQKISITFCLIVICIQVFFIGNTFAQSNSQDAVNWFRLGVNEQTTQGKINAYKKAIQIDPHFTEALYNLGHTYKSIGDFRNAENYFQLALEAEPDMLKLQLKLQIMYELSVVLAENLKLGESEKVLRDALYLSKDNTLEGLFALELAKVLYRTERYENALAELKRAKNINPKLKNEYKNLITVVQSRIDMESQYREARRLETQGNLAAAKSIYEELNRKSPGYEDVEQRLAELNRQARSTEHQENSLDKIYNQAIASVTEGNYSQAITLFELIVNQDPNYKDARNRLSQLQQRNRTFETEKLLNVLYAEGVAASNNQKWQKAVEAFDKAVKIDSNYRDAALKLQQARAAAERESMEALITQYYKEGTEALNMQQYKIALAAFERVQRLDPTSKNITALIMSIRDKVEQQEEKARFTPTSAEALAVLVDSLHQAGLALIAKDDWDGAVNVFEKLNVLVPDDPTIESLLQRTREHVQPPIIETSAIDELNFMPIILYGGIALAVIVLGISIITLRKKNVQV